MNLWFVLFKKECLEMVRNFKVIWVPLTFLFLGAIDPLTAYYMPKIIDALGGLPEGTVIEIPLPSPGESLLMSVGQFDTLGVLIIALMLMGTVAGERKSGVAEMVLVKPVPVGFYISAKWAAAFILVWLSYFAGMLASWYYTGILFGWIPFGEFLACFFIYGLWLTFVMTMTIFYSSLLKSPGLAGFLSIATAVVLGFVSSGFSHWIKWSPALLKTYAGEYLLKSALPDATVPALLVTAGAIIALLIFSSAVFRKKELAG